VRPERSSAYVTGASAGDGDGEDSLYTNAPIPVDEAEEQAVVPVEARSVALKLKLDGLNNR